MKKLILSLVFISTISIQAGHHEMAKDAKSLVKTAYATFASGGLSPRSDPFLVDTKSHS